MIKMLMKTLVSLDLEQPLPYALGRSSMAYVMCPC